MPYQTTDGFGTDALFAVDITGQAGGELSVFSPMVFLPPDTLALDGTIVDVPLNSRLVGRLRLASVAPNPSSGSIRLEYEVPVPGGPLRIRVYDVAGRLVAEPFTGKREPGVWTTQWDATDARKRILPAGVYIVQLRMDGQSLVRQLVLTR